jgi:hypothetical protein
MIVALEKIFWHSIHPERDNFWMKLSAFSCQPNLGFICLTLMAERFQKTSVIGWALNRNKE